MKRIENFDQALAYAHRLGMARGNGRSIAWQQANLCAVTDALATAAGGYPYSVHFTRNTGTGYGEFSVFRGNEQDPIAVRERDIKDLR